MRAQSSIEFMILFGASLVIMIGFLGLISYQHEARYQESRTEAVYEIAASVQHELAVGARATPGYERGFYLPRYAYDLDYEISIIDSFVYIRTLNGKHALSLPIVVASGQPVIGYNVVRNDNNSVFLNE